MAAVFILGKKTRRQLSELAARAAVPANWYRPGPGAAVPGDLAKYTEYIGTCRIAFSWTVDRTGKPWRHLSISTYLGGLPDPTIVFTVAEMLGFTGAVVDVHGFVTAEGAKDAGWAVHHDERANAIVVAQSVGA